MAEDRNIYYGEIKIFPLDRFRKRIERLAIVTMLVYSDTEEGDVYTYDRARQLMNSGRKSNIEVEFEKNLEKRITVGVRNIREQNKEVQQVVGVAEKSSTWYDFE